MDALPAKEAPPDVTSYKSFCQTKPQNFLLRLKSVRNWLMRWPGDSWSFSRSISMIIFELELMTRRTSKHAGSSELIFTRPATTLPSRSKNTTFAPSTRFLLVANFIYLGRSLLWAACFSIFKDFLAVLVAQHCTLMTDWLGRSVGRQSFGVAICLITNITPKNKKKHPKISLKLQNMHLFAFNLKK